MGFLCRVAVVVGITIVSSSMPAFLSLFLCWMDCLWCRWCWTARVIMKHSTRHLTGAGRAWGCGERGVGSWGIGTGVQGIMESGALGV